MFNDVIGIRNPYGLIQTAGKKTRCKYSSKTRTRNRNRNRTKSRHTFRNKSSKKIRYAK